MILVTESKTMQLKTLCINGSCDKQRNGQNMVHQYYSISMVSSLPFSSGASAVKNGEMIGVQASFHHSTRPLWKALFSNRLRRYGRWRFWFNTSVQDTRKVFPFEFANGCQSYELLMMLKLKLNSSMNGLAKLKKTSNRVNVAGEQSANAFNDKQPHWTLVPVISLRCGHDWNYAPPVVLIRSQVQIKLPHTWRAPLKTYEKYPKHNNPV